ncbi:MAG TPA: hypothetical protein VLL04_12360, partial [Rhizomicrobium sp.]|nr:hypothetical protein [Rhizomicrobium sp.]
IVVGGDVVLGTMPGECLERLTDRGTGVHAWTIGLRRRFRHATKDRVFGLDQRLATYPQNAQSLSSRCDENRRKNISAP